MRFVDVTYLLFTMCYLVRLDFYKLIKLYLIFSPYNSIICPCKNNNNIILLYNII